MDSSTSSSPPCRSGSKAPHAGHAGTTSSTPVRAPHALQVASSGTRYSSALAPSATVPVAAISNDWSNASGWTWWNRPTRTFTIAT